MNRFGDEFDKLNNEQKKVVSFGEGKAICIAGPGSGKTRVIVLRALGLLINDEKVLTLAYNKTAAEEMRSRSEEFIDVFFSENAESMKKRLQFTTIHAYCYEIIRKYVRSMGDTMPKVIDENEKNDALTRIYREITGAAFVNKDIIKKIERFMQTERDGSDIPNDPYLVKISQEFKEFKEKNNYIDFDDMLDLAKKILSSNDEFKSEISSAFGYIQIDEAQDLSQLQTRIIELVSQGNVLFVADDDQSIYAFRGAMPEILKKICDEDRKVKLFSLSVNYRSGNEIVRVATDFIEQNRVRFRKRLKTKRKGGAISIETFASAEYQALFVARRTLEEVKANKTVGILYRNNVSNILPLIMLFIQSKIKNADIKPDVYGQKTNLSDLKFLEKASCVVGEIKDVDLLLFSDETRGKRRFFTEVMRDVLRILERHTKTHADISKLSKCIDDYSAVKSRDREETGSVTFSTIHSAKGLEFDTVFIIDCVKGEFPHGDSNDPNVTAEERRLMYVAMTRAKSKLYITYPQKVGNIKLTAGQFIEELLEL